MTDIKEVALPELPGGGLSEELFEAIANHGASYKLQADDPVRHVRCIRKLREAIEAYAQKYGALCYEAGKAEEARPKLCCGEYETCGRPCVPRGIELGKKEALRAQPSAQDAGKQDIPVKRYTYSTKFREGMRTVPCMVEVKDGGYVSYKDYAALKQSLAQPAQGIRPTDDGLWDKTLRDRDQYHDMADELANAIAEHFDADIGEHSNQNCPWQNALEVIAQKPAQAAVPEGWKRVPIELTEQMAFALDYNTWPNTFGQKPPMQQAWSAVLSAAPESGEGS